MGIKSSLKTILVFCTLMLTFSAQAQLQRPLPAKNISVFKPFPKVPRFPNIPISLPNGLGGVSVGGGLMFASACGKLQNQVLDKGQVEAARTAGFDVSDLQHEFFQAMVDIAFVLSDLQKRSEVGNLQEKHYIFLDVVQAKLSGLPVGFIDRLMSACNQERASFLFLTYSSKQLAHFENALDYLVYFGKW